MHPQADAVSGQQQTQPQRPAQPAPSDPQFPALLRAPGSRHTAPLLHGRAADQQTTQPSVAQPAPVLPTPARTRLEPQSAEWRARCVELAREHELVGMAMPLPDVHYGVRSYLVPSQSDHGTVHRVEQLPYGGVSCHCTAATYGQPCGHAGAVLAHEDAEQRMLDPREAACSRDYWHWWMWFAGFLTDEGPVRE